MSKDICNKNLYGEVVLLNTTLGAVDVEFGLT